MSNKLSYKFVKCSFEKEGYTLLSKKYISAHQMLNYTCPDGHKHYISWTNWQQRKRCPYCAGKGKPTIKFIKKEFEKEGYILLTKEYKNNRQKLKYVCPHSHVHAISWSNWKHDKARCPYCNGVAKPNIEFIKIEFEKENYVLLTNTYKNCDGKLEYVCPENHKHTITWDSWQRGCRCSYCCGNIKHTIEFIKAEFNLENYKLLTNKYINNRQKLSYVCSDGHLHSITWRDWVTGKRCPECAIIKMSGPGHPNWKGGISCEPYCDIWTDKEYKKSIRERDGDVCLNPICKRNCSNLPLTIHHIDYNKKNCDPKNLITVCKSCNSKANFDRDWHESWYKAILNKRYVSCN